MSIGNFALIAFYYLMPDGRIAPNWVPEGVLIGLTAEEITTLNTTGTPLSTLLFHAMTAMPGVTNPIIVDPTKAANAKAQTLQTRLDGLIGADGQFYVGQVKVTCDRTTQGINCGDA